MRKLWTLGFALASVAVLSSCNAIDVLGNGRGVGIYELRSVNGSPLPTRIYQEPGYSEDVMSATFSLETDGSYSNDAIIRQTTNGRSITSTSSSYGYYDEYTGDITFNESGGRRYYGTLTNGRLVINDQGLTMVYQRY